MHSHTPPDASRVGLPQPFVRRQSAVNRAVLAIFALSTVALLSACGATGELDERLGAAPVVDSDAGFENEEVVGGGDKTGDRRSDNYDSADGDTRANAATGNGVSDGDDAGVNDDGTASINQADGSRPTTQDLDNPDEALEKVGSELKTDGSGVAPSDQESLDAVEPLDHKPGADESQDLREGSNLNESGEQNIFDEAANLACADVEVALTAIDEARNSDAVAHVISAAERADQSRVATLDQWRPILRESAGLIEADGPSDVTPLLAFLSTCTQGGYEL